MVIDANSSESDGTGRPDIPRSTRHVSWHVWAIAAIFLAGNAAVIVWHTITRSSESAIVVVRPSRQETPPAAPPDSNFAPLVVAQSVPHPDRQIVTWLTDLDGYRQMSAPPAHWDEPMSERLATILRATSLDALSLAKIDVALFPSSTNHGPTDRSQLAFVFETNLAAIRFAQVVNAKVHAGLDGRTLPDTTVGPLLEALRLIREPLMAQGEYALARDVLGMLAVWEPIGSAGSLRARLKYADMIFEASRGADAEAALKVLDPVVADVENGLYPTANIRDVAELKVGLLNNCGRSDEAVTYLRKVAKDTANDPVRGPQIKAMLVKVLLQLHRTDEAAQEMRSDGSG